MYRKVYIDPSIIQITPTGLFLNLNQVIIPVSFIGADDNGIFISPICAYEPWHDDDWLCPKCNHWSPCYENRCVYLFCGKSKPLNPKRWKDVYK